MSARLITALLATLLVLVHAELWFGSSGMPRVMQLQTKLKAQNEANHSALKRNEQLRAEVLDLREGLEMVEEKARYELGMVKPDEILVQIALPRR